MILLLVYTGGIKAFVLTYLRILAEAMMLGIFLFDSRCLQKTITLMMAVRNVLPRCIAFRLQMSQRKVTMFGRL